MENIRRVNVKTSVPSESAAGRGNHGDYHRTPTAIYILFTVLFLAVDLHGED